MSKEDESTATGSQDSGNITRLNSVDSSNCDINGKDDNSSAMINMMIDCTDDANSEKMETKKSERLSDDSSSTSTLIDIEKRKNSRK